MVKTPAFAILFTGMTMLSACTTVPAPPENPDIRITYINAEKFTDVGDSTVPGEASRAGYLEQLRKHLAQQAITRITAGQKLDIFITEVDMAGHFEPWHVRAGNIRIIRDIYPPRINLRFTLTTAEGTILREGERQLRNPAFLIHAPPYYRDDPLRYEKVLLDDWLDRELPPRG